MAQRPARVKSPAQKQIRNLKTLRNVSKKDPYTRQSMKRVLADKDRTIKSVGRVSTRRIMDRMAWVPLGADPELRKVTVATVLRKMNQSSARLKREIQKNPNEAVWDVVFVGAGVHTAIAANALANASDVPMKMLTIEGSNTVAQTFRGLGDTLARNSANRAEVEGAPIERGFGNKNPSLGPWGDPDLAGSEWPGVKGFADVATVNLYASGTDTLMKTQVAKVRERGPGDSWPTRYQVETKDGLKIFTNQVVVGTGLGKPNIPSLAGDSAAIIEKVRSSIDYSQPHKVPAILTAEEALRLGNLAYAGRDPYRPSQAAVGARTTAGTPGEEQVTGRRIKTNLPARLRGRDPNTRGSAFDLSLDEVLDFQYDANGKVWTVKLRNGDTRVADNMDIRVGSSLIPVNAGEDQEALGKRLATVGQVRDVNGRPTALNVEVQTVTEPVGASGPRTALPRVTESRLALLRKATGQLVPEDEPNMRITFNNQQRILSDIADITSNGTAFNIVFNDGTTVAAPQITVQGRIATNIAPQDVRFQQTKGDLPSDQLISAQVKAFLGNPAIEPREIVATGFDNAQVEIPIRDLRSVEYSQKITLPNGQQSQGLKVETTSGKTFNVQFTNAILRASVNGQDTQLTVNGQQLAGLGLPPVQKSRLKIAVIGGGDSARTFLEYLYGQAPESAYTGPGKNDTAQRGDIGDVTWVVGEKGPADCNTFLQTTRSRYLRLAGKVRAQPGSPSRAQLIRTRMQQVEEITQGPNAGKYLVTVGNAKQIFDRVVLATGYTNEALNLFEGGKETRLQAVEGELPNLSGKRVLGKQVDGQDIFLIGPAAGGDVVGPDERFNTNENAAALFAFRDRNVKLIRDNVAKGPRALKTIDTAGINRPGRKPLQVVENKGQLAKQSIDPKPDPADARLLEPTSLTAVVLKAEMGDVLDQFRFPGLERLEVRVGASKDGKLDVEAPLDEAGMKKLTAAINESPILVKELQKFLDAGESVKFSARVRPGSTKEDWKGLVRTSTLKIEY